MNVVKPISYLEDEIEEFVEGPSAHERVQALAINEFHDIIVAYPLLLDAGEHAYNSWMGQVSQHRGSSIETLTDLAIVNVVFQEHLERDESPGCRIERLPNLTESSAPEQFYQTITAITPHGTTIQVRAAKPESTNFPDLRDPLRTNLGEPIEKVSINQTVALERIGSSER